MFQRNSDLNRPLLQKHLDTMEELVHDMYKAADQDQSSLEKEEPALAKLRMLPRVEEQTAKQSLQDSFIDAGGLGAIREWLRLLPDNSLPNLTIRTSLLQILRKLTPSITLESLKESKVGFAVRDILFHEEEIPINKRVANEISEMWLRSIFGRDVGHSAAKATEEDMRLLHQQRKEDSKYAPQEDEADEDMDEGKKRRRSAIASLMKHNAIAARDSASTFRIQPATRVRRIEPQAAPGGSAGERISRAVAVAGQRKSARGAMTKVSVEGRGLQ